MIPSSMTFPMCKKCTLWIHGPTIGMGPSTHHYILGMLYELVVHVNVITNWCTKVLTSCWLALCEHEDFLPMLPRERPPLVTQLLVINLFNQVASLWSLKAIGAKLQ